MTLPGNKTKQEMLERIIRVDQAGEYGAKRIYAGQLAVLKGKASEPVIQHMAEQEQKHLDYFNRQVSERGVRPTLLQPLWHVGAWLMGAGTAMLGEKAAMACTEAVESVIDQHYQRQLDYLDESEGHAELKKRIEQFRIEEMEHHDTAIEHDARQAPAYAFLKQIISLHTKAAIWLSERV